MSFKYEETLCPECNGEMVSRTGKFGVFWGCKKYPECKGTRDSQGRSKADREAWKNKQLEKSERDEMTAKQRRDKEVMDELDKEIDAHDLKEGQKTSFNRNVK